MALEARRGLLAVSGDPPSPVGYGSSDALLDARRAVASLGARPPLTPSDDEEEEVGGSFEEISGGCGCEGPTREVEGEEAGSGAEIGAPERELRRVWRRDDAEEGSGSSSGGRRDMGAAKERARRGMGEEKGEGRLLETGHLAVQGC